VNSRGGDHDDEDQAAQRRAPQAAIGEGATDDHQPEQELDGDGDAVDVPPGERDQQRDAADHHRRIDEHAGAGGAEHGDVDQPDDKAAGQRRQQRRVQQTGHPLRLVVGHARRTEPAQRSWQCARLGHLRTLRNLPSGVKRTRRPPCATG
jgi:hypothetical protein